MKNYISEGCTVTVTLAAAVTAGDVVIQGGLIGVAVTSGEIGDDVAVNLEGAYSLPKKASLAITQGDAVYWDATPGEVTKTATDGTYLGVAFADADSSATTAVILLERDPNAPGGVTKQANIADLSTFTVSDATGNTTGDINGVKNSLVTHLNTIGTKVNALLSALEAAGVLTA